MASATDANGNPTPTSLQSDQGANAFTTITVTWSANGTWASSGAGGPDNNAFPDGPDKVLMSGYLDTGDATTTTTVALTNIPPEFTALGYDVYVYTLGDSAGDGGGYRIVDTKGTALKDWVLYTNPKTPSTYVEVPQTGGRGTGNYIVFKGLTAPAITVQASTQSPQGGGTEHRAPINAIQLVPSPQPVGPPTLSAAKSAAGLVLTFTGKLQSAPAVTGPWTDAANVTSPALIPTSGNLQFYRAKQ
jgi:hypothetical protein